MQSKYQIKVENKNKPLPVQMAAKMYSLLSPPNVVEWHLQGFAIFQASKGKKYSYHENMLNMHNIYKFGWSKESGDKFLPYEYIFKTK